MNECLVCGENKIFNENENMCIACSQNKLIDEGKL